MDPIYIIDATGYLFRSYFAIPPMTNPQGESTHALFGFIRSLLKLFNDFQPKQIVAVFDGPNNSAKREQIYPQYKSHRAACPPDLGHQIEWAKTLCGLLGISILDIPDVEADDTMGSVAVWAANQGHQVYLCTSDKDLCQLVSSQITVLNTHKDNLLIGPEQVQQNYGIRPDQMIDYLAIVGDSSDNIPGIPGFGPKTAANLLQEFGSLEELLEHPERLKGKKQETVRENAPKARLSKQLAIIDTKIDIPKDPNFYIWGEGEMPQLRKFYLEMGFHSLLTEIRGEQTGEKVNYVLVDDESKLQELMARLSQEKEISIKTETTDPHPLRSKLVGIGFSVAAGEAFYIPTEGKIALPHILETLKPLFENPKIGFFGHHIKADMHVLKSHGIEIAHICFDIMVASYVLNAHQRQHSLDALTIEYLNKVKTPLETVVGKGKKVVSLENAPLEKVCAYCCEEVDYIFRIKKTEEKELKERGLEDLYYTIELPLTTVLASMERKGIYLDIPYTKKMAAEVLEQTELLQKEIYSLAGEEFNLNSPKQLSAILFEKMGIKPPKKIATGYSTNADVLEILRDEAEIIEKIIQYRTLAKLQSTYLEVLPEEVDPKTERIHCTFNQSVAATGRLSSQNPNLQNIPIRSEIGKKIRAAFRPQLSNWSYLSADYSQIELRLLAHFSEDPQLLEAFHQNQDVHQYTASILFGVPIENVTPQMRYQAKTVNFGVIYGQQAFGLSRELHISVKDAASFIEMYFQRYGKVKSFVESCKNLARKTGKTVTITGRERMLPDIHCKNTNLRLAAERLAVNTPLQGTAADLIKIAMIQLDQQLTQEHLRSEMILQIHDELIFEVPNDELFALQKIVKSIMENVWQLKVPLLVDIHVGKNWEEC